MGGNSAAYMLQSLHAAVAELVDALALGASAFGRGGSSPLICTIDIIKNLAVIDVVILLQMSFFNLKSLFNT